MSWKQPRRKPISSRAATNAKALRRELTEPESRLWWHLRTRLPREGTHFRRQVAIGPYVADFLCHNARIVVEVDGAQHGVDAAVAYDERRSSYLAGQGFRILRFSNRDVMLEIDVVLDTIHAALVRTTPTPDPSPQGGGAMET
ncbi:MAG: hypothetical protein K0S56_4611 [Microvirga sp.]|jgi:very-short-patch-repair endonuclease|nr:hypothetical protein [Microvirga sp.]